jgi:high-affinity iron transporter
MLIWANWSVFAQSASIILREGLEVVLVLAALVAFIRKSGAETKLWALYFGAGAGIAASIAVAVLVELFFEGHQNPLVEGIIFLLAAALMIYVSGWLFVRQDPRAWQAYLKTHAEQALKANNQILAIALLSGLSVLREGAESILFVHTLAITEGWSISLFLGLAAALAVMIGLFMIMQVVSVRLPLRPLFISTSALLLVMALKFIGSGLMELQEHHLVPDTDIDSLPSWWEAIGLNPTWEALMIQGLVLAGVVGTFTLIHFRSAALSTSSGR